MATLFAPARARLATPQTLHHGGISVDASFVSLFGLRRGRFSDPCRRRPGAPR